MIQPSQGAKAVGLKVLSKGAAWMPFECVRALMGISLVVPYYHMVSDQRVPHVSELYRFRSIAEFMGDMDYLLRHFEPVALRDIVDALNGKRILSRPCFHPTFDDGFREMHDIVAPILQRAGVPATFFLNTAFLDGGGLQHHNALSILVDQLQSAHRGEATLRAVDSLLPPAKCECTTLRARVLSIHYTQKALLRSLAEALDVDLDKYIRDTRPYLSSDQIRSLLARGFSIGAHSHDHPLYADLSLKEQLAQTWISLQLLETQFGLNQKAFAFPHTDRGVEGAFFSAVFSEQLLDVSFGTGGLVSHFHPRNIERVCMEGTSAPAAEILARQFLRAAYLRFCPQ
jgi:peptidoglycan/xylan/chitin deacetylase (PgdA/CDA1 family)